MHNIQCSAVSSDGVLISQRTRYAVCSIRSLPQLLSPPEHIVKLTKNIDLRSCLWKECGFFFILMNLKFLDRFWGKILNVTFHENLSSWNWDVSWRQTDRQIRHSLQSIWACEHAKNRKISVRLMWLPVRDTKLTSHDSFCYTIKYFVCKWKKFVEPDKIKYKTFCSSINYGYIIWYKL